MTQHRTRDASIASPARVFVVHPLTLLRDLLARTLGSMGLEVVGTSGTIVDAELIEPQPDVVLVDETALFASASAIGGSAAILLLMATADDLTISRARELGVAAFALTSGPPSGLADTVRRAAKRARSTPRTMS